MNTQAPPCSSDVCCREWLTTTEEYVSRKPMQAAAVAFGAGLLLNLLPTEVIVKPLTVVASKLLQPALISLGLIKVFELCCQRSPSLATQSIASRSEHSI